MTSPAVSPLIAELDDAVKTGSSERRVQMLRQVTDLFLSETDRLNEQQISVFDDVLLHLVERVEARALAQLSVRVSDIKRAPKQVVRQLSRHKEINVAGPVLARSNQLSDRDLVAVAQDHSQDHLLAISGRETLSESVTDVLLQRGNIRVSYALAGNVGARFSPSGYSVLVSKAEKDEGLTEKVGLRPDIPVNLLKTVLSKATDKTRSRMTQSAPPDIRKRIQSAIETIAAEVASGATMVIDYAESSGVVLEINRVGRLNEAAIARFAREREYGNCIVALSLLTKVAVDVIEPLFCSGKPDGLIVACRAANLGWATTLMVLRSRPGQPAASLLDLEQSRQMFQALTVSSAQRTVRAWSASSVTKKLNASKSQASTQKT